MGVGRRGADGAVGVDKGGSDFVEGLGCVLGAGGGEGLGEGWRLTFIFGARCEIVKS